MSENIEFQEDPPRVTASADAHAADKLLLDIDGFEGPIDVLLELAKNQKVDITKVSILQLVRQYLAFIERAKAMELQLAAEYLVMAAWLAYLKSRLLLPRDENDDEISAEEMAEALQFQLRRLSAMQESAEKLKNLPQLGQGVFARGMPEGLKIKTNMNWDVTLYEMLKAYGNIHRRKDESHYEVPEFNLMSTDDAITRLTRMLGGLPRKGLNSAWATLQSFLPEGIKDRLYGRSSMASLFTAGLELAKQGKMEIKQDGPFRPIYLREVEGENVSK